MKAYSKKFIEKELPGFTPETIEKIYRKQNAMINRGFFYDRQGGKKTILFCNREFVVMKHWDKRKQWWRYSAESVHWFFISLESDFSRTVNRKDGK